MLTVKSRRPSRRTEEKEIIIYFTALFVFVSTDMIVFNLRIQCIYLSHGKAYRLVVKDTGFKAESPVVRRLFPLLDTPQNAPSLHYALVSRKPGEYSDEHHGFHVCTYVHSSPCPPDSVVLSCVSL